MKRIVAPMVLLLLLIPHAVFGAELYFGTSSNTVAAGTPFEVGIFLNTEGESVNTVTGAIVVSPSMRIRAVREGGSLINFWIESPQVTPGGTIVFSGIVPGGYQGSNGYLFSLVGETDLGTGTIEVRATDVQVLRNDGNGTALPAQVAPLTLIIGAGSGSGFLPPFDGAPPEAFTPEVVENKELQEGKRVLVFSTQDKDSGIDHYEIIEEAPFGSFRRLLVRPHWIRAESPYLLHDQTLRSRITVMVVDKAGNTRTSVVAPRSALPWYENILFWGILIGGVLVGRYMQTIWKQKQKS